MKFKPKHLEKLRGNDLIYNSFDPNTNRHKNNFKELFSCPNSLTKPVSKTQLLNWKVQTLLMWVDSIFPLIWILGVTISIDKTTMHLKVHHKECF